MTHTFPPGRSSQPLARGHKSSNNNLKRELGPLLSRPDGPLTQPIRLQTTVRLSQLPPAESPLVQPTRSSGTAQTCYCSPRPPMQSSHSLSRSTQRPSRADSPSTVSSSNGASMSSQPSGPRSSSGSAQSHAARSGVVSVSPSSQFFLKLGLYLSMLIPMP